MTIKQPCPRGINLGVTLRHMGYHPIFDRRSQHGSWVRSLSGQHYPRFHMYVSLAKTEVMVDLHLDQKQSTIKGSGIKRHAGEYNSPVVEAEAGRIKRWLRYACQSH